MLGGYSIGRDLCRGCYNRSSTRWRVIVIAVRRLVVRARSARSYRTISSRWNNRPECNANIIIIMCGGVCFVPAPIAITRRARQRTDYYRFRLFNYVYSHACTYVCVFERFVKFLRKTTRRSTCPRRRRKVKEDQAVLVWNRPKALREITHRAYYVCILYKDINHAYTHTNSHIHTNARDGHKFNVYDEKRINLSISVKMAKLSRLSFRISLFSSPCTDAFQSRYDQGLHPSCFCFCFWTRRNLSKKNVWEISVCKYFFVYMCKNSFTMNVHR